MSDAPGPFVVRPDPRRYLREAATAVPLILLAAVGVAVRLADDLGTHAAGAMAALLGPPLLLAAGYVARHVRTVRLTATGSGVELTDWRGRRWRVRRVASVVYCTIYSGGGRMEHIVLAGHRADPPVLLRTRQWRPDDLAALWRRLGVAPEVDDLTSAHGVQARFPRAPLPFVTRYPMTVGALCALLAFGWIALVISTVRALAER